MVNAATGNWDVAFSVGLICRVGYYQTSSRRVSPSGRFSQKLPRKQA
jgi:hypothetical protein